MTQHATAHGVSQIIAQRLAAPPRLTDISHDDGYHDELRESLARGHPAAAVLHIERALVGVGDWATAHSWVRAATERGVHGSTDTGLYLGAPAICFVLHAASADGTTRYASALAELDRHVIRLTHHKLNAAHARLDRGDTTTFAEYDLFHGLTGLGALLLLRCPGHAALDGVLRYLVRLAHHRPADGQRAPAWWVSHDPDRQVPTPGGHANLGIAHGIAGPLALLGQAARHGVLVDGHTDAIAHLAAWLDTWRQDQPAGPWWPQWITLHDQRTGRPTQRRPGRASWCYGTPGLARAQQIAAIATNDTDRQARAENALLACVERITDPDQLTDAGLCHGWAGLYQTAWRAAQDARTPAIAEHLPRLANLLVRSAQTLPRQDRNLGMLEGDPGIALALLTAERGSSPLSGWDSCLLIN